MRRSQWLALAGIAVLLVGAVLLRTTGEDTGGNGGTVPAAAPASPAPGLGALRSAADLAPCPVGLGPALPDLTLPCLSGGPEVALRSAAPGRPTLVNVWATWCPPCQRETPDLVAFAKKAGDRVGVVGVLHQSPVRSGLAFNRDYGVHYPSVVDDDGDLLRAYSSGPPLTLFLTADGQIAYEQRGAFSDLGELEALVAEHLGVRL